jgi:hypothetical protein
VLIAAVSSPIPANREFYGENCVFGLPETITKSQIAEHQALFKRFPCPNYQGNKFEKQRIFRKQQEIRASETTEGATARLLSGAHIVMDG